MDQQLKGKQRQEFLDKLKEEGYEGSDEIRILEFLIREPELDRWLGNEFPRYTLQQALTSTLS